MDFSFSRNLRVRKASEYAAAYASRLFAADEHLVLNAAWRDSREAPTRLGLSIGRAFGSAPARNRWKRLVREAFRLQQHRLPSGLDLIVRPQRGADPGLQELCDSLVRLARRIDRKHRLNDTPGSPPLPTA